MSMPVTRLVKPRYALQEASPHHPWREADVLQIGKAQAATSIT